MKKKKANKTDKITKLVVWFMLLATLVGIMIPTYMALSNFFK